MQVDAARMGARSTSSILLAAEEKSCWTLGFPSVRSWARLAPCLCEEIGIDDLTRRKGTPRRAWWQDLRVRGDLDTE
jgi:hypothetical protein